MILSLYSFKSKFVLKEISFHSQDILERSIRNPVKRVRWSLFVNIFNGLKPLTIAVNIFMPHVCLGSEFASGTHLCFLCLHNYFKSSHSKLFQKTSVPKQSIRSSHWRCSIKEGVLNNFDQFIGKHLYQSLLLFARLFIKNQTMAQAFSCEIIETFKNTFLTEDLWPTISRVSKETYFLMKSS